MHQPNYSLHYSSQFFYKSKVLCCCDWDTIDSSCHWNHNIFRIGSLGVQLTFWNASYCVVVWFTRLLINSVLLFIFNTSSGLCTDITFSSILCLPAIIHLYLKCHCVLIYILCNLRINKIGICIFDDVGCFIKNDSRLIIIEGLKICPEVLNFQ